MRSSRVLGTSTDAAPTAPRYAPGWWEVQMDEGKKMGGRRRRSWVAGQAALTMVVTRLGAARRAAEGSRGGVSVRALQQKERRG